MKTSNLLLILYTLLLISTHNISYAVPGNFSDAASQDLIGLVSLGFTQGVKNLLEAGECDVNYVNEDWATALSVAAGRNDDKMMQLLLEHGADPTEGAGIAFLMLHANVYHNQAMLSLLAGYANK